MHGEWESEVVRSLVAVCGEEEAALRVVCALVTTLKNPETSAPASATAPAPHGVLSQHTLASMKGHN